MRFSTFSLLLSGLASQALGAAIERRNDTITEWDAIIVGGGPAGLSVASGLARVRRNVLLIDSAEYRNAPTRHVHDVIGYDGVTPAYLRWRAREQLAYYDTLTLTNGTVTKIEAQDNNTSFRVSTEDERTYVVRKVVLATGLKDILPDTPGIQENWGKGIYWCPWCDGHEHADQPLGLIANLTNIPGQVREILSLNRDIVAFTNGTDTPEIRAATEEDFPNWETYLEIHNVTVENAIIGDVVKLKDAAETDPNLPTAPEFDLFRVDFADGSPSIERNAFFVSFPDEQRSTVGEEAGVVLYGGRLGVDPTRGLVTNVPGLYAIGDANSDNVTNVPHAMFSGKRTAVFLHVAIERENSAKEIEEALGNGNGTTTTKRDMEEMEALWARMNPEGDVLHAGSSAQLFK